MPHQFYDMFITQLNPGLMAKVTDTISSGEVKVGKLVKKDFSEEGCRQAFKDLKSKRTVGKIVVEL